MGKAQYPIDGKPGKAWKVTSYMGWRIHPVYKDRRHHNGTDIVSKNQPCYIEAPFDGKVVEVGSNPSGFGNYVKIRHKINGQWYVTLYGHMAPGSIKVKKGQTITAGTPIGKMGKTGVATGVHLHWELYKGKKWVWNKTGKGYLEPVNFFAALIKMEQSLANATE